MDKFLLIFISILLYVIFLFILRYLKIGSKTNCSDCNNCCPDCSSALNRIKRLPKDKIIYHITFRIFDNKRYICRDCGWEGLRWERKYKPREHSNKH